jgi:acylphosphatase
MKFFKSHGIMRSMNDDNPRYGIHVLVFGVVQGVNFRRIVRDYCLGVNVQGWIRNLPDGSVEAEFYGKESAVKQVIDFCRTGVPRAVVENISVRGIPWTLYEGFQIR